MNSDVNVPVANGLTDLSADASIGCPAIPYIIFGTDGTLGILQGKGGNIRDKFLSGGRLIRL